MKKDSSRHTLKYLIGAETAVFAACLCCAYLFPHSYYLSMLLFFIASLTNIIAGFKLIEKEIDTTMQKVDDTIQSLIDNKPAEYFSQTDDTLLGKFQMHILRLRDILISYERQEKELRMQISETISNLVHQINTPVTNIKMYSAFLEEDGWTGEDRLLFVKNICSQAAKLEWLAEGLLKVSRLETGIISISVRPQPVLPTILRAVDQVSLKAREHGNEILLYGSQDSEAEFDEKWTEEVFYNLLDNAVKYGIQSSEITIELLQYELFIRINVKNTGPLIRQEEYSKIFQRFYRSSTVRDQAGVGLGLYLSREILRKQKGYIKVASNTAHETVFSVFLPKVRQS